MVWFPRCPATYLTRFTAEMLRWFEWLELFGKTPFDMGLPAEAAAELDPRYEHAMRVLKREFSRIERAELERIRNQARAK